MKWRDFYNDMQREINSIMREPISPENEGEYDYEDTQRNYDREGTGRTRSTRNNKKDS